MGAQYEARFWAKVSKTPNGCWQWVAHVNAGGYGVFNFGKRKLMAHRVAYELSIGPIASGLDLDHTCHTNDSGCAGGKQCLHRRCVNPAHLEPITHLENCRRGRQAQPDPDFAASDSHCGKGHEYTEDNTYLDEKGGGNAERATGKRCDGTRRRSGRNEPGDLSLSRPADRSREGCC